MNTKPHKN